MYKSIVLSILCVPLVSFGMESGSDFNHMDALSELHPYFSHTEFLNALSQQETQSIACNTALQPMQECDVAPYERMAQGMDSALDDQVLQEAAQSSSLSSALLLGVAPQLSYTEDESFDGQADKEDTQLSVLYDDSTLQHMQARCDAINTQGSNYPELQAADLSDNYFLAPIQCNTVNAQGLHFPDLQSAQIGMLACDELFDYEEAESMPQNQIAQRVQPAISYNASRLKEIQERYAKNKKQCPIDDCTQSLKPNVKMADHVAAMHKICLLCKPPLDCADRAGIVEHFMKKHPQHTFSHRHKKEACKKCGNMISCAYLQIHTAGCKRIKNMKYTLSELKELKRIYKKNDQQCPIESCSKVLTRSGYVANHAAGMHKICLLCDPPLYCDDREDMRQHFKKLHPSTEFAARGEKIACGQCGKEMVARYMDKHLREVCKMRTGSAASATMSDKN